ncbi:MAG: carbohydrate kinase family protein [Aestuariivirga sp.]|uniref:carbohydrate kinase family protein n=1 Tax=Aestuariivirga sp. TaxID=2650926 RepID=UPI0038D0B873
MAASDRRGFVTGGTWCVDFNKIVSHWPREDGLAEYLGEERANGGSGSNFALDMRQLDPAMPLETIALIGDDDDGRFLLDLADKAGIDRSRMQVTAAARTHYTDAFVSEQSHRRTHIYFRGTSALLSPDHFDFSTVRARILHLGLPGVHRVMDQPWGSDANGWVSVLRKARAAGIETNMELASVGADAIRRIVTPCLPHLDTLVVNDVEIGAISGLATSSEGVTDIAAATRAAQIVLGMGVRHLVVVHSPVIAIAVTHGKTPVLQGSTLIPAQLIASANGAGDAFAAGMMFGWHEGWEVGRCLKLAHASAACSLRGLATTGTIEPWQDCLALAESWGWRG